MDGQIGVVTIIPEQMGVVNPLLILVMIPFFDYAIYPVLEKFGLLTRPLQRLAVGGLIAAAAFVVSALLEFKIEVTIRYSETSILLVLSEKWCEVIAN
jgi:solute carrier family 15 oligopeptide transporter 1